MPHHHGSSGTSAGVSQGTSSSSSKSPGHPSNAPSSGVSRSRIQSDRQADFKANPTQYKSSSGGKGTISRADVKNVSLAGSLLTKNPVGAVINLLSRFKGKSKPPKGHPETIAKSKIKRTPVIEREGGDGMGGTQMAATSAQAAQPIKPKPLAMKPYYMGFDFQQAKHSLGNPTGQLVPDPRKRTYQGWQFKKGGLSGGERFGPPPKKGPDPHGKCPFRPDGIRGVGAVEKGRGVKFIGTK